MKLNTLPTFREKEAFANLALTLAKADGSLDLEELSLLRLFLAEMGFDEKTFSFHTVNLEAACQCFSQPASKNIVLANLARLCTASSLNNGRQKHLLQQITIALQPHAC